jgi:ABC-type transporter Mla MlaB component
MDPNGGPWLALQEWSDAPGTPPEPGTTFLVLAGPIGRADVPGLCELARVLMEGCDTDLIVCDVGAIADPDAVTVDVLSRLQLTARRLGRRIELRRACDELEELLAVMGLSDVLPCRGGSGLDPRGHAEEREQPLGVEEERDPGDPTR